MKIIVLGLLLAANYAVILYRLIREWIWVKKQEKEREKLTEEEYER